MLSESTNIRRVYEIPVVRAVVIDEEELEVQRWENISGIYEHNRVEKLPYLRVFM